MFEFTPGKGFRNTFFGPQLNVNFYDCQSALNFYINILGYYKLDVDLINEPLWELYRGVSGHSIKVVVPYGLKEGNVKVFIKKDGLYSDMVNLNLEDFDFVQIGSQKWKKKTSM